MSQRALAIHFEEVVYRARSSIGNHVECVFNQPWDFEVSDFLVQKTGDGDLIGCVVYCRCSATCLEGVVSQFQAGVAVKVRSTEVPLHGLPEVERAIHCRLRGRGRAGSVVWQRSWRGAKLSEYGAVDELDEGVGNALRMNDHFESPRFQTKQPVRFDQFEAFIGHGRGIDRYLRPHRPVRMLGCVGRCDAGECFLTGCRGIAHRTRSGSVCRHACPGFPEDIGKSRCVRYRWEADAPPCVGLLQSRIAAEHKKFLCWPARCLCRLRWQPAPGFRPQAPTTATSTMSAPERMPVRRGRLRHRRVWCRQESREAWSYALLRQARRGEP